MKVTDIINLTAKMLGEVDVKNCINYCEQNNISVDELLSSLEISLDYVNEQSKKDLRLILDCINIIITKIATENYPIIFSEKISVKDDSFNIDTLSQKLFKIKEISQHGIRQKFACKDKNILIPTGEYLIKYAILPTELTFSGDYFLFGGKLSILTLCYGTCACFAFVKGMYEEADRFEQKFESALNKNFAKLSGLMVKKRRWI